MIELNLPRNGIRWSARLTDDAGTMLAEHAPHERLKTASVGKVFLLAEVARQLVEEVLDPTTMLAPTREDIVADSGLLHFFSSQTLTVTDLCVLVGAVSDNSATNILLRHVGLDAVTELTRWIGVHDSALHDFVRVDRRPTDPPTLSSGTAADLVTVCAGIQAETLVSPEVSRLVKHWLSTDTDLSMVAAPFNLDPLAHTEPDRGITLWNKTGTISHARIDVGHVEGTAGGVTYAVLANWNEDRDCRDEVLSTMQAIGKDIRAHVS